MKLKIRILIQIFLIISTSGVFAQNAPVVSNVQAEQRSSDQLVEITFDVADADGDSLFVGVQASDDGGETYDLPIAHLTGDIGYAIAPGSAKQILWESIKDYPEEYGDNYRVKVFCIDAPVGKFVHIPTDTFTMGNDEELDSMKPEHKVIISAYYILATEITNIQYKQFCDATERIYPENPVENYLQDYPDYPAVNITWFDAIAYCNWLSELQGYSTCYDVETGACDTTKSGFRLPTEAEWERAARGGFEGMSFPWGTDDLDKDSCNYQIYDGSLTAKMPNFENNRGPVPVASFPKRGYGLHDMAGNVAEWCNDWYSEDYYTAELVTDPTGPETGSDRVLRGGDWNRGVSYSHVFQRDFKDPQKTTSGFYRGFRIVRRVR